MFAMTAGRFRLRSSPSQGAVGPVGRLVALDASAFPVSGTGHLAARAAGAVSGGTVLALHQLDAEALLGRRRHPSVTDAIALVGRAEAVVLATPLYRGTYSGSAKAFFDLLPPGVLDGVPCLAVAVGPQLPATFSDEIDRLVQSVGGHLPAPVRFVATDEVDLEDGVAPAVAAWLEEAVVGLVDP